MLERMAKRQLSSLNLRGFHPLKALGINEATPYLGPSTCQDLYAYTSGRFLFNEELRLRERYVKFDPNGLLREVERHLGPSHGHAARIAKMAEGGFNRVFCVTMDDGFEVVAKIPYHIAGPKYYATASEAASLRFLYSKGIPVPKLYGYSALETNPAGVEYIIMEMASGVGLETTGLSMGKRERHKLASSFVEIEKKFFDLPFRSIGSIYFKADVSSDLQAPLYGADVEKNEDAEMFCIGPTADYMFWHGRRASLNLNRGPWNYPKDYLISVAQKEIEWTQRHGTPLELDFPHNGVFPGEKSPEDYLRLLDKFVSLAPFLLPKAADNVLNRPTLRHPDLNPHNIFIAPDTGSIACIIDWQHTTVQPRLLVAGYPRTFENPDAEQSPHLKEPSLPPDYETLPAEQKTEADELYRRRLLFYYYRIFNGYLNKPHLEALRDPILSSRQHLVDRASRQWTGNLMLLKGALVRMVEYWPHLPETAGKSCPVQFTDAEMDGFSEQEQLWFDLNKVVSHWLEQIGGVGEDGWIGNDQYEEAVQKAADLKASLIANAEGDEEDIRLVEKGWLFRDREETS